MQLTFEDPADGKMKVRRVPLVDKDTWKRYPLCSKTRPSAEGEKASLQKVP